ncbi:MAG: DUF4365 domain-containing protein [Acidobacteriota bacterium]
MSAIIEREDELPLSERLGTLGVVHLRAIAAVAGYTVSVPESDYDSVDLIVKSRRGRRSQLEFQVKCTTQIIPSGESISFELPRKNYDDLRADTIAPRVLFVVLVPKDTGAWLQQNERRMHLRHCGYWFSLRGFAQRPNSTSVTVQIPRGNLLTPAALQALMAWGAIQ